MVTSLAPEQNDAPFEVAVTQNAIAAWLAETSGTCAASSRAANHTVCSINIGAKLTHLAICKDGDVIDTACFDLGYDCVVADQEYQVVAINEGGETFLDAVAKRIHAGDRIDERLFNLIGELIAETIVNLPWRARPPQVSQRLLCTEPLWQHHPIDEYVLSGLTHQPAVDGNFRNLWQPLSAGIKGALADRQLAFHLATSPAHPEPIGFATANLDLDEPLEEIEAANLPVLPVAAGHTPEPGRLAEFKLRHNLGPLAPYIVASGDQLCVHIDDSTIRRRLQSGTAAPLRHIDYIDLGSRAKIKRLQFKRGFPE